MPRLDHQIKRLERANFRSFPEARGLLCGAAAPEGTIMP